MVKRIFSTMMALMMALTIISFVPQTASAAETTPTAPRTDSKGKVTWDCVYFGNYPQTTAGDKAPIKWRVLSVDGNDAFLMADKGLDWKKFNETKKQKITWETCTLRSWLNGYDGTQNANKKSYINDNFINKAFTATEQQAITETTVTTPKHPYYGTFGGNDTKDKIYLLSFAEAKKAAYGFPANNASAAMRTAKHTAYVNKLGKIDVVRDYGGLDLAGNTHWWLRTLGDNTDEYVTAEKTTAAAYIHTLGGLDDYYDDEYYNYLYVDSKLAVRPVLHLDLSSNVWKSAGTVSADKTQEIKVTSSIKKPYSSEPVKLKIASKTVVKYTVGNVNVAGVASWINFDYLPLFLNSPGKTKLTINAPASKNFNSAKKVVNITVLPRKMSAPTLKSGKTKALTVNWKKDSKVTGYKVIIAKDKNFKTGVKTFTTSKNTSTVKTFTGLSSKKTYYVKTRAYKKWGTEKLWGAYSNVKSIKVK